MRHFFKIVTLGLMLNMPLQAALTEDQTRNYQAFMSCFPDYTASQKNVTTRNINNGMPTLHICDQAFSDEANKALVKLDFLSVIKFENCSNVVIPAHQSLMMIDVSGCQNVFLSPKILILLAQKTFLSLTLPSDFPEKNVMEGDQVKWLGRDSFNGNPKVKYAQEPKEQTDDTTSSENWSSNPGSGNNSARGEGDPLFQD